jgi:hypothetical protein
LRWLRETVAQSDLMNADASGPDWQRAEQVLALQYLRSATAP